MKRTLTLTYGMEGSGPAVTAAELAFIETPEQPGAVWIDEQVALPSNETVTVNAACTTSTGNVSVAVFCGTLQLGLFSCRWTEVAPYVGMRLPSGGWLHVYFLPLST
jgi:hypothetical protein